MLILSFSINPREMPRAINNLRFEMLLTVCNAFSRPFRLFLVSPKSLISYANLEKLGSFSLVFLLKFTISALICEKMLQFVARSKNTGLDDFQSQHWQQQNENLFNVCDKGKLTCEFSETKKRSRDEQIGFCLPQDFRQESSVFSTGITKLSQQENQLNQPETSTSGKPFPADLADLFHQQNQEIDAFIRNQYEKLIQGVEEKRKRHTASIHLRIQQNILQKLKEKETELANVNLRSAALLEKLKQIGIENQVWKNAAKNNEAVVFALQTNLQTLLLHPPRLEISGDNDAESCCYEREKTIGVRQIPACKVCREKKVSILLLPCKHLCLCKDCGSRVESCPLCNSLKNASIQVRMD